MAETVLAKPIVAGHVVVGLGRCLRPRPHSLGVGELADGYIMAMCAESKITRAYWN